MYIAMDDDFNQTLISFNFKDNTKLQTKRNICIYKVQRVYIAKIQNLRRKLLYYIVFYCVFTKNMKNVLMYKYCILRKRQNHIIHHNKYMNFLCTIYLFFSFFFLLYMRSKTFCDSFIFSIFPIFQFLFFFLCRYVLQIQNIIHKNIYIFLNST